MRIFYSTTIRKAVTLTFTVFFLYSCTSTKPLSPGSHQPQLKFLNEYVIPNNLQFQNTRVGGLSGIDYDSSENIYVSISDDRSEFNPARFYTYKIKMDGYKIDTVAFQAVTFLKNPQQQLFPSFNAHKNASVDPEALRFVNGNIAWSDEGLRQVSNNDTVLVNPRVFLCKTNGEYIDTFQTPPLFHMNAGDRGPRNNGGFEGLAMSPDKRSLFVSTEEPLINDGPRAGLNDSAGIVRIIKFDLQSRQATAQYAYKIDPVAHEVTPPSGFRVNGISDILFWDDAHLLVVERSYSTGRLSCTIRVYLADLKNAQDVSPLASLAGSNYQVLPKRLLINMDTTGIFIDNIEGVTFGPVLPNGHRSLIFIADNNFNRFERSQLLLFEIQ